MELSLYIPAVVSALAALSGVWLGGWLTTRREIARDRERIDRESRYLASLVVAHLDRFVIECADVSADDGYSEGRPAGAGGEAEPTVKAPVFDPLRLQVDWRVLPVDLMHGILSIPSRQEHLQRRLAAVADFPDPPDHPAWFWERQYAYTLLGQDVLALAGRLRSHAGLPKDCTGPNEVSRAVWLTEQLADLEAERATRDAAVEQAQRRSDAELWSS